MAASTLITDLVQDWLAREMGTSNKACQFLPVGGGSINETYEVRGPDNSFFCKVNSAVKFPQLFRKEKNGLELLSGQGFIRIPSVIGLIEDGDHQVLLLEWIREGERSTLFWKRFGEGLAGLHQVKGSHFGGEEDNFMGSVPQCNRHSGRWTEFFILRRIQPMVNRCLKQGLLRKMHLSQFETLYARLDSIFDQEKPCLLHGDLWSGNFMCSHPSEPVLIDPAVYYGHRSADLAMTTLFGGFSPLFYEAYEYHYPFPSNYREQWKVVNLYPLLIHLFLFGSGYLPQIESVLKEFG